MPSHSSATTHTNDGERTSWLSVKRRGSGIKKILGEYNRFESLKEYRAPEFNSNATEFYVTLWNLNYGTDVVKDVVKESGQFTKEFVKARRLIFRYISQDPEINATQMAEKMNVSLRQMQRYLKQLTDLNLIAREGGRKNGTWKILDKDYDDFFERI